MLRKLFVQNMDNSALAITTAEQYGADDSSDVGEHARKKEHNVSSWSTEHPWVGSRVARVFNGVEFGGVITKWLCVQALLYPACCARDLCCSHPSVQRVDKIIFFVSICFNGLCCPITTTSWCLAGAMRTARRRCGTCCMTTATRRTWS